MQQRKFKDLMEFAKFLEKVERSYHGYETATLTYLGDYLVKEAKGYIGNLQEGGLAIDGWQELAESTKRDKERKGYVYNQDYNPLYRTGALKDSIGYKVAGSDLSVGSTSDIMIYQEMGTLYIPPRSVLGLAFYKNKIHIERTLGDGLLYWMTQALPKFKKGSHL